MGIDKSLNDDYPSVLINGSRYHFGRHPGPEYDYYLVENAHIAKDYWWFDNKEDFLAFLGNLPESADPHRMQKLYPDWHGVSDEEREQYRENNRARLADALLEKQNKGTAPHFPIYPDDGSGPYRGHEPFRIENKEPPLARVERMISDLKHYQPFDHGLTDAGKLSVLERLDWAGVCAEDKEAILAREVNFERLTKEQIDFVFEDIRFDTGKHVSDQPARQLFENATASETDQKHGPGTVHFNGFECEVERTTYANGRTALILVNTKDREEVAVATVNLPDAPLKPGEVFIKDYSENKGMLEALEKAGIVKATGEKVQSGFVEVPVATVLEPSRNRNGREELEKATTIESNAGSAAKGKDAYRQMLGEKAAAGQEKGKEQDKGIDR